MDKKVTCIDCDKIFANLRSLSNHRRRFHNPIIEKKSDEDVPEHKSSDIDQNITDAAAISETNTIRTDNSEPSNGESSNDESNQIDSVAESDDQENIESQSVGNNDQINVAETSNDDDRITNVSDSDSSVSLTDNPYMDSEKTGSMVTDSESDAVSVKSSRSRKGKSSRAIPYKRNGTPTACRMSDKKQIGYLKTPLTAAHSLKKLLSIPDAIETLNLSDKETRLAECIVDVTSLREIAEVIEENPNQYNGIYRKLVKFCKDED